MKLKKFTQKDRYGNMRSFEFDITEGQMEVPPMTSSIPMYDHPGEPKGTDTVPAWLTPGEFVVNKEATDIYGPIIKKMNDHGREIQNMKPEYAEVGMPVPKPSKDVIAGEKFKNKRSRQSDIYNYLKENYPQLTDDAIAGIMGNIGVETGYTYEYTTRQNENTGDQMGPGMGLFQFDEQKKPYLNYLKANNKKDSMASQLDYFVQSIYNKDAVPHPKNESGFRIGKTNAENLQASFANKDAKAIALDIMNKHLKPGIPHADRRANKAEEIKELIDNKVFGDPSVYDKYREAGIQVPPSSDGFSLNIPNPFSGIKEKATSIVESVKDFIDPNDIGFKFTKPEKVNPFKEGGAVHLDPGGKIYGTTGQTTSAMDDDIMKLIFDSQQNVAKANEILNDNPLSSVQVPEDDSTTISFEDSPSVPEIIKPIPFGADDMVMESNIPDPIGRSNTKVTGFEEDVSDMLPLDQQTFVGNYSYDPQGLGMEELGMEMPPPYEAVDENMYDDDTGDIINLPRRNIYDDAFAKNDKREIGAVRSSIKGLKSRIKDRDKSITNLNPNDPKYAEKVARLRKEILDFENKLSEEESMLATKLAVAPGEGPEPLFKAKVKDADLIMAIQKNEKILTDKDATKSEKDLAQERLNALKAEYEKTESAKITNIINKAEANESEANLNNAASKIDDATANKISTDLANNASIINTSGANDPKNPNVQKAKDAMKFLFGDLIDAKEIGRAAAVYLGSRALGYDHNSSINYVAKQYLKRVDAKTAQIDKYIADNADKFEPISLQAFKDSRGDYSTLIPKGAKVRSTGERKPWFGKDTGPSGRMAYQFKIKTGEGDLTYWSFDINGKSRIGAGYSEDGSKVKGSDQFNEAARKKIPNIKDQMEELLNKHARKLTGVNKTTKAKIYEDYTNLTPANSAEEIAFWAQENGISLQRLGPGLKMAVIAAAENFTNPPDGKPPSKAESLIPYLEEATIKQRLDIMVPGLTQAKVGDEVVQVDTDTLMNINDRVKSVSQDINQFYNEAADIWNNRGTTKDGKPKGINPDTGKLWRKEYEEAAKKPENEGLTPYALFVIDITNKLSGVN
tara:strand:- start:17626 stop:20865 length:3240 start_codon:yes stop_codon:yes gene_type:complete